MQRFIIATALCSWVVAVFIGAGQPQEKSQAKPASEDIITIWTVTPAKSSMRPRRVFSKDIAEAYRKVYELDGIASTVTSKRYRAIPDDEVVDAYPLLQNRNCQCGEDCACVDCKCEKKITDNGELILGPHKYSDEIVSLLNRNEDAYRGWIAAYPYLKIENRLPTSDHGYRQKDGSIRVEFTYTMTLRDKSDKDDHPVGKSKSKLTTDDGGK